MTTLREFRNEYATALLEIRAGRLSLSEGDSDEGEQKVPEPDALGLEQ